MASGTSPRFRRKCSFCFLLVLLLTLGGSSCRRSAKEKSDRYFSKGLDDFGQEKYDAASIEFRNALQRQPRAWAPRYWLALTDIKLRRWQDAYKELNIVIELQPAFSAARLELADLLSKGGKRSEAREQISAVLALNPKNARARILLAKTYLLAKDFPRAIEEYEKAKQLVPKDPDVWSSCALAEIGTKQYALAERDFHKALEIEPHSAEAYRNMANLFRATGRTAEVEPFLRQALATNPRSLDVHLILADFYFQQGRMSDLESLFRELKDRAAEFSNVHLELGEFWMWRNDPGRAVEEYQAVLAQEANPLVEKKLTSAYITLGRLDEAEHLNQKTLSQNAKDLDGRSFEGALRHLRGDPAGAAEELRAVLKEDPKSLFANYYLGLALLGSDKSAEAEGAFTDCVRYDEDFVYAFERLAELRLQQQDWDAGLEYAKRIAKLMPQRPDGYLLAAQAYLNKGETPKAEQILRGVQKGADSAEVRELLGAAYVKEGKIQAGVNEYEQAWAHSAASFSALARFADVLVKNGKADVAEQTIQQLITSSPQADYYKVLARLQLDRNDPAAAEAASHEALRLESSSWLARFYLAEAYDRLQRADEALAQYDEVIRQQPKQIPPYVLAGDVCLREGRFDRATGYYEAARKQDPGSVGAEHGVARVWAEEGSRLDEATAVVQGLQSRLPDDPYLSDTLAWIYYRKGQYALALPLLKRSEEQQPKNALVHFHLGMIYAKVGEINLSRRELERALKLGLDSARWQTAARQALTGLQASS